MAEFVSKYYCSSRALIGYCVGSPPPKCIIKGNHIIRNSLIYYIQVQYSVKLTYISMRVYRTAKKKVSYPNM